MPWSGMGEEKMPTPPMKAGEPLTNCSRRVGPAPWLDSTGELALVVWVWLS